MKIIERKINELIPADYNPRTLTDKQYKDIKNSLKKFGFVDPVIVNTHPERKNIIIGGHQRLKVWADLGNETAPTVELCLTLKDEQELNVRLNKNTGSFDFDALANYFEVGELLEWGFDEWEFGMNANSMTDDDVDITEEFDPIGTAKDVQRVVFIFNNEKEAEEYLKENNINYKKMAQEWQVNLSTQSI